ncbi:DUF1007 family protein [Roseivivax sp. GX 12232]|uniref:DUF1007 family protein n=1 Tax=Roseivivax sp. GX 12232 TaxID=2900547 RepID=UPI001E2BD94C|nr:DUF1007 family protein [Roseivivax sp. GX 12232]MCE0504687.1 DUF1007 family protein [Roseivivax sp. GX 12232]
MRRYRLPAVLCAAGLWAGGAGAHPHIFIDTQFALQFDAEGRLTAVAVEWRYDAFYSMLVIEENGLDSDGDGTPEDAALSDFAGQDVDWEGGFPGDFQLLLGGEDLALGTAQAHEAGYVQGQLVTRHIRPLPEPLALEGREVLARAYDPTYFVAYDVPEMPTAEGPATCEVSRSEADTQAAEAKYGDLLAEVDETGDPFEAVDLPDIGILFADSFRFTCAPSS